MKIPGAYGHPLAYVFLECTPAMPRGVHPLKHLLAENAALYRTVQTDCLRKAA